MQIRNLIRSMMLLSSVLFASSLQAQNVTLTIGDSAGVLGSHNNMVAVSLDNPSDFVRGLQVSIEDEGDILTCTGCSSDPSLPATFTCSANEQPDGKCNVVLLTMNPADLILWGNGPVLTVDYSVNGNAPPLGCRVLNPQEVSIADADDLSLAVTVLPGIFCIESENHFTPVAETVTWMLMGGTFTINAINAEVGDEVGVFVDNNCFGAYTVDTSGRYGPLFIYGDNPGTPEKDGAHSGDPLIIKIWDSSEGIERTLTADEYAGPDPLTWTAGLTQVNLYAFTLDDIDGDGVSNNEDNCPHIPNDQTNSDSDSHGDACDNCLYVENEDQMDSNNNGKGDACEVDGPCGDIYPPEVTSGAGDCGDGVVDLFDVLESIDIILGKTANDCQIVHGDIPNGEPPNCGNPAGEPNCQTNGDLDILDTTVVINKASGKENCCDYCFSNSECTFDEDCNDFNDCTQDVCNGIEGGCQSIPYDAGTTCGDGDPCNGVETCDGSGICEEGIPVDCSYLDTACEMGSCNPDDQSCESINRPDLTICEDDGNQCNGEEICTSGICSSDTNVSFVELVPMSGVTSLGGYRSRDIANNEYDGRFYTEDGDPDFTADDYTRADVTVTYNRSGSFFEGHLNATGLKPNFAYQVKLSGMPTLQYGEDGDDQANENIGYAGRWYKVGVGNASDADYEACKNDPGCTDIYLGYLVFGFFTTDQLGNGSYDFVADTSLHVLWRDCPAGLPLAGCWGPGGTDPVFIDVSAKSFTNYGYDKDFETWNMGVYGEIERQSPDAWLADGEYNCHLVLTEESFHESGLGGQWASTVGAKAHFWINQTAEPPCDEATVYEDAEDGTTDGWYVYDDTPGGAGIDNVIDDDREGNVIQFTGFGWDNGYRLTTSDGDSWHNSSQLVVQWDMKYTEYFTVYIDVETTAGHRYLTYTADDYNSLGDGEYVLYGLGIGAIDGQWHTIVRDLEADLAGAQPEVTILEVNGFLIRGSGRVDDIKLLNYIPNYSTSYEDAEDGTTDGWYVYDDTPGGAGIDNVIDDDREGNVIQFTGFGWDNGYRLTTSDGDSWHNSSQLVVQWDMKYTEYFTVYIDVETTAGHRYLTYTADDYNSLGDGEYVLYGLGIGAIDGQWHTIVRDLEADLAGAQPEVTILEVNGFLIRGSGRVDDIKLLNYIPNYSTSYEDAEDGTTDGWYVYDDTPGGAGIDNVIDDDREGNVIQFTGFGWDNGYRLTTSDGDSWHNSSQLVVQWDMKYTEYFTVYIDVETTAGHRYLTYTADDYNSLGDGEYVLYGLGIGAIDGQWHTIVRDLEADLAGAQPEVTILEVNGFLIRGSGRVDDIKLLNYIPGVN